MAMPRRMVGKDRLVGRARRGRGMLLVEIFRGETLYYSTSTT